MPRRSSHKKLSKWLLGNAHSEVHKALDWPHKLLGRRHRILFHDPLSAMFFGAAAAARRGKNPLTGAAAGVVHVAQDMLSSAFKMLKPRRRRRKFRLF